MPCSTTRRPALPMGLTSLCALAALHQLAPVLTRETAALEAAERAAGLAVVH